MQATLPGCYHPTDYRESQAYGALVHDGACPGIAYDSVRRADGQCFGIFDPKALSDCKRVHDLEYEWNGATQTMTKTRMEIAIE
jgi:RES domain